MSPRAHTPNAVETEVLTKSRRRCCICFGLRGDINVKPGQIAHLDRNHANSTFDNLAWLCLEHHDDYDGRTSQSKNFTISEVKRYRQELYEASPHLMAFAPVANNWKDDLQEFRAELKVADWREEEAFKDVLMLPLPAVSSRLPFSEIAQFANRCSVTLEGYGGIPFPLPPYGDVKTVNRPNGVLAFKSGAWYRRDWMFDGWFMRTDASLFARSSLDEDHYQPVHKQKTLRFVWALMDIVRPLSFLSALFSEFPDVQEILIVFSWGGLHNRMLYEENWRVFDAVYLCHDDDISLPETITRDSDLQEVALKVAKKLFWLFQWSRQDDYTIKSHIQSLFEGRMPK